MLRVRAAAAAAALLAAVAGADAQRVVGTAKAPGAGGGGMLIVAADSAGTELAKVVTAEDGRFALILPRPGFARVELLRVGFKPTVLVEKAFGVGETVTLEAQAGLVNTDLPPRGTVPPASCTGTVEGRRYVAILFEEARKALTATQLGLSRAGVTARWANTDHRIHANGRDTARFSVSRRSGPLLSAFGVPALAEIQRSGFVAVVGTDRIFRGFDVPTLLSPWFTQSYCFTAQDAPSAVFVLAFKPQSRRRDYVDVEGEITFARATMEILSIDYRYVGLTAAEADRQGGGRMEFARADGGTWLVSRWWIRFPQMGLVELETFRAQNQARVLNPEVLGHEILGGHTTALLEGTRKVYVRDAGAIGAPAVTKMTPACPERVLAGPTGAFRGRLTSGERPVSGSRIRATWRTAIDIGGEIPLWRDEIREAISSSRGDWVLCDLPVGTPMELSWEVMGRRSTSMLRAEKDEVLTVDTAGKIVPQP